MTIEQYRARDARIAIGYPIRQDNGELEYPGFIDGVLVGFYARPGIADLALRNILAARTCSQDRAIDGAFDVEFAPFGF